MQDFRRLEKVLISKNIIFEKAAIAHGKGEFTKSEKKHFEHSNRKRKECNGLPRLLDSNRLIVLKLKRDLKYQKHLYYEPMVSAAIYTALCYFLI